MHEPSREAALADLRNGDPSAAARLTPLVHDQLHALAAGYLRHERKGHTLQPTALVNEAFLRLFGDAKVDAQSKTHFVALAATTMRRVLVDHARKRAAQKRGGALQFVTLDAEVALTPERDVEILAVDEALAKLAALDSRQARIVELRFFGGLQGEEIAGILGVSRGTVQGDWNMARAWLRRELGRGT